METEANFLTFIIWDILQMYVKRGGHWWHQYAHLLTLRCNSNFRHTLYEFVPFVLIVEAKMMKLYYHFHFDYYPYQIFSISLENCCFPKLFHVLISFLLATKFRFTKGRNLARM